MSRAPDTKAGRYGAVAISFHWLVLALLVVQFPLAWIMTDQPAGIAKLGNYALHKSMGLTNFGLTVLRLLWRLGHRAPALPPGLPAWQRWAGRLTQGLLYFLLFAMPLTGWFLSSAANVPVSWFGFVTLPNLVAPDEARAEGFEEIHELQGTLLLVLAGLHAAAALHHHYVRRDGVLAAMLPPFLARSARE